MISRLPSWVGQALLIACALTILSAASGATSPRSRLAGPVRFELIDPDSCRTRAAGFTVTVPVEVAASSDTNPVCWSCMLERDKQIEEPICCTCSIWHSVDCVEHPAKGRYDLSFSFCRPHLPTDDGRAWLRLSLLKKDSWTAAAETTVAVPRFPSGQFASPRHPILGIDDEPFDPDGNGRANAIGLRIRIGTACKESVWVGFNGRIGGEWVQDTRAFFVRPPEDTIVFPVDGSSIRGARITAAFDLRIYTEGEEWNEGTPHHTRTYSWQDFEPVDVELVGGPGRASVARNWRGDLRLRIEVPVHARTVGTHWFRGRIQVAPNYWIYAHQSASLRPGDQIVTLEFEGKAFFERRRSGPYKVTDLWCDEDYRLADVETREPISYAEFAPR